MKTLLLSLLLTIGALLLIGFKCDAQSNESDHDWIDSLEVKYRTAFIESSLSRDQAVVDSLSKRIDILIFNLQRSYDRTTSDDLIEAILQYDHERRTQALT